MLKRLDYGSGYNPRKNFYTADIYGHVDYYIDPTTYKLNTNNKFDFILARNVLHHIKNLDKLVKEFYSMLNDNGRVAVIEPAKEYYKQNYILDYIWYRFVIPRYEVWFCDHYRDYEKNFIANGFRLLKSFRLKEKEVKLFLKREI